MKLFSFEKSRYALKHTLSLPQNKNIKFVKIIVFNNQYKKFEIHSDNETLLGEVLKKDEVLFLKDMANKFLEKNPGYKRSFFILFSYDEK